jgi:hypothetical protein
MLGMDEWDMQTYTNAEAIAVNQVIGDWPVPPWFLFDCC